MAYWHSSTRRQSHPTGLSCRSTNRENPSRYLTLTQAHVRRCVEGWRARGIDLAAFTTEENADDVESLRAALGAPKITLLAGSYGSHLALAVLRRHPTSIGVLSRISKPPSTVFPDDLPPNQNP